MYNVHGRIMRCLISLGHHQGRRADSRIVVVHRPPHQEIAAMAGCSRVSVTRSMKFLQQNGYVSVMNGDIVLEQRALQSYWDDA